MFNMSLVYGLVVHAEPPTQVFNIVYVVTWALSLVDSVTLHVHRGSYRSIWFCASGIKLFGVLEQSKVLKWMSQCLN